jgi:hypothetical protein
MKSVIFVTFLLFSLIKADNWIPPIGTQLDIFANPQYAQGAYTNFYVLPMAEVTTFVNDFTVTYAIDPANHRAAIIAPNWSQYTFDNGTYWVLPTLQPGTTPYGPFGPVDCFWSEVTFDDERRAKSFATKIAYDTNNQMNIFMGLVHADTLYCSVPSPGDGLTDQQSLVVGLDHEGKLKQYSFMNNGMHYPGVSSFDANLGCKFDFTSSTGQVPPSEVFQLPSMCLDAKTRNPPRCAVFSQKYH